MWEAISKILTSSNAIQTIIGIIVIILLFIVMIKTGMIKIKTSHVYLGLSESDKERTVIREQCDFTHTYLMGLVSKIEKVTNDGKLLHGGYFTKWILEQAYDEFVKWITQNHISTDKAYIHAKQEKIKALVYSMGVRDEFKTAEFCERMDRWVAEIIEELVSIRKLYM